MLQDQLNRRATCLRLAVTRQTNPAGETGSAGAEGETAPETLRQKDRGGMTLWKAAVR
jgi:hypothetical protein